MYIDDDGREHDSYEDYCNSNMLDPDIVATYLLSGKRKPQNDYEKALLEEMKEIRKQGYGIELNFNYGEQDDIKKAGLAIYPDDGKRDELNLRYTKQMRPAF